VFVLAKETPNSAFAQGDGLEPQPLPSLTWEPLIELVPVVTPTFNNFPATPQPFPTVPALPTFMPLQLLPNVPQSTLMPSSFDSIPTLAPQFIDPFDAAAAVPINDPNFNRGVLMMTTPSIFGAVQWYRPDSMPEPLFAASGGYPVWRLDAHEIAYARVSFPNISTCRYNVLLQALPTGCPSVAQFLPFPRIPGSMWDPVVSPDGSRMAFLRVNNYSTRVDVIVRNLNDTQGTSEVNLTVSLPASTIAVMPAWSPTGNRVSFAAGASGTDFRVHVYDFAVGGAPAAVTPPGFALPMWSDDGSTVAAAALDGSTFIQYSLGTPSYVAFNPASSPKWGRVFVPNLGSASEYAYLTNFSAGTFEIVAPNVPAGTRGLGIKAECPECGLSLHGVTTAGAWTLADVRDIFAAVTNTAEALRLQFGGERPLETFRRILLQSSPAITFERSTAPGANCNATYFPLITCYATNQPSQYTFVHELGHGFTKRTGFHDSNGTYYIAIRNPLPLGYIPDSSSPPNVVMGPFDAISSDNLTRGIDWDRGQRGWGSAAANTSPLSIPYDFQQSTENHNDLDYPNSPLLTREVDEAAADMFLNWVYSRLTTGEVAGFKNRDYKLLTGNCPGVAPTDTSNPGDARYTTMTNGILPLVSTWFPTVTRTPPG